MVIHNEDDGTTVEEAEQLCKHALPLAFEGGEGVWCSLSSLMCYKMLGEPCDDEEPVALF